MVWWHRYQNGREKKKREKKTQRKLKLQMSFKIEFLETEYNT